MARKQASEKNLYHTPRQARLAFTHLDNLSLIAAVHRKQQLREKLKARAIVIDVL